MEDKVFDPLVPTMEEMMHVRDKNFGLRAELAEANYQRLRAERIRDQILDELDSIKNSKTFLIAKFIGAPVRFFRACRRKIKKSNKGVKNV